MNHPLASRAYPYAAMFVVATVLADWDAYTTSLVWDGDFAADSIRARSAWTQTSGIFSRWNFHHPGPLLFWMKAVGDVVGRALPGVSEAGGQMLVVTVLAALAIGVLATALADATGRRLVIPVAYVAAALCSAGTQRVVWAATVAHWLVLLGIGALAAIPLSRRWALAVAIGTGLGAAHLHLLYVPFALLIAAGAIGLRITLRARFTTTRREIIAASAVAAAMLAPVLVGLLAGSSSWSAYLRARNDPAAGFVRSWGFALLQLVQSTTPARVDRDAILPLAGAVGIVLAGTLLAALRSRTLPVVVVAGSATAWVAYLACISRLDFIDERVAGPITPIMVAATAAALVGAVRRTPAVVGVAAAITIALGVAWQPLLAQPTGAAEKAFTRYLAARTDGERLIVRHDVEPWDSYAGAAALTMLALSKGADVCVAERQWPYWVEPDLVCDALPDEAVVVTFISRTQFTVRTVPQGTHVRSSSLTRHP